MYNDLEMSKDPDAKLIQEIHKKSIVYSNFEEVEKALYIHNLLFMLVLHDKHHTLYNRLKKFLLNDLEELNRINEDLHLV